MNGSTYPMLATLVQAYFHQDYDEPDDSIGFAEFARTHSIAERQAFIADAQRFMADQAGRLLEAFERIFQPDLVLADDDAGLQAWLEQAMIVISPQQT